MNEIHEAVEKGKMDVFLFASLCRFPIYQATSFDAEDCDGIEAPGCQAFIQIISGIYITISKIHYKNNNFKWDYVVCSGPRRTR